MVGLFSLSLLNCYTALWLVIWPGLAELRHPIHVSTTEINYNAVSKTLEVTCTIFTDDLEAALEKSAHKKADLQAAAVHAAMDDLLKNYIAAHVALAADNKSVPLKYLGFEVDREAVNIYEESQPQSSPKALTVNGSLLYDLFDDQMSIVHMIVNGKRKSGKILTPQTRITQTFP